MDRYMHMLLMVDAFSFQRFISDVMIDAMNAGEAEYKSTYVRLYIQHHSHKRWLSMQLRKSNLVLKS